MDEFLYVVSHDLQEPLRTLVSFSDFLLADYGDRLDDQGREFVRYLVDASRRMRSLIQDLTTLSRAGKVTREFDRVNLSEVLKVVRADLSDRIRSRGGQVDFEASLPEVWGDRDRIGQLFTNLITNGLKYNQEAVPRVTVTVDRSVPEETGWVTIQVSDNGIGIDSRYHQKIFQLFRRLHTQEEYEGTGAGLAICQKIVQAHGGTIRVMSESNHGSTFLVSLPRPPESP
ncbi:MAG: ATP-binding protein [Isosphaeraceae bacterium]